MIGSRSTDPSRTQHGRRWVTGVTHEQVARCRVGQHVDHRHELLAAVRHDHAVQVVQHLGRVGVHRREGPGGRPHLGHGGRRGDTTAHDVTDEGDVPPVGEHEGVVEVAADLGPPGRPVVAGDLPPVVADQGLGKHGVLQLLRRGPGLAVELGVVHRGRRPAGQVLGEAHVVLLVEPVLVGGDPGDHADHPAPDPQRHEECTAQLQLAGDAQLLGVTAAGDEHLVGDLVDQLGLPGQRHRASAAGAGGVRGVALVQRDGQLDLAGVDVGDGQPVHPPVTHDVDGTPVGEGGHRQSRHPLDRDVEVEAARQLDGGLGEELQPRGLPAGHHGRLDALEGLGAGVGHDVEEVELGRVGCDRSREREVDRPDRPPSGTQREVDQGAFPSVDAQVGIGPRDGGPPDQHQPSAGADRVGDRSRHRHGDELPPLRLAGRQAAQPDDPRVVALAQGDRGDRRAHGIRHVVGHDLHDGVDRVGRRQLPGDPGQARQALPDPLSDAGRVVAHPEWGHHGLMFAGQPGVCR